jgi:GNAT superfamily N-acetyltransferase
MSTPATFHIEECTPSDLDSLVHVYLSAFTPEPNHIACFPNSTCSWESQAAWLHTRFSRRLNHPGPGERHFKVVESATSRMASFARWEFPHSAAEPASAMRDEAGDMDADALPDGANVEACREMFGGLEKMQKKWVDEENMYLMGLLATDPQFQGKGCGTMLLKYGLEKADKEGRKAYIEATPAGLPLYKKLGWVVVDEAEIVNASKDVPDDERRWINWIMIREPIAKN